MADWYVLDAEKNPQGPLTTEEIAARVAAGTMTVSTPVNLAGSPEWRPVFSWPQFRSGPSEPSRVVANRNAMLVAAGASAAVALAAGFGLGRLTAHPTITREEPVSVPAPTDQPRATRAVSPPAQPAPRSALDELMATENLASAVAIVKPQMEDTFNKIDAGSFLLAAWMASHLRLGMVKVPVDEVTIPSVMKDPDEARGKRMCMSGSIIQIELQKLETFRCFEGILMTDDTSLVKFVAVGSSGNIVERSSARVCGVVTGKLDYSNSAGGTGHAVKLIGMFDLPANK